MQTRPYPEKDGVRIWLSRTERVQLLEAVQDRPKRALALRLALHGLRTDEINSVEPGHVRALANGAEGHVLRIPQAKRGPRETPISAQLADRIQYFKRVAGLRQDEPIVDVSKRTLRNWIQDARAVLEDEEASALGMHDLRRTWATDAYYSLAVAGIPIAEQLVMSWGGWAQTSAGRETFRRNYLGPVPDHVVAHAWEYLPDHTTE